MPTVDEIAQLKALGLSWRQIAERTGSTYDSVRNKYRRNRGNVIVDDVSEDALYYPSARDINDTPEWLAYLKIAARRDRMLKIFFWPDMHIPDTNWQAVALARQIRRYIRPDVDFMLGDEDDLDTVSTHWARPENRKRVDAFKEIERPYYAFHDDLDRDYMSDIRVRIGGNHTFTRIENLVNEKVPMLADTIIEAYINMARANGRVKWLGWGDEIWLNHYHIEHGTRYGEMSAKNSLKDAGWSSPRTGGHVHAPSEAWNYSYVPSQNISRPDRVIIQSVTLPALCNIHPHYAGNKKKSRWMNGVGVAYVNLNGMDVHQHKIIFHTRADGSMSAAYGSEEFVQTPIGLQLKKSA